MADDFYGEMAGVATELLTEFNQGKIAAIRRPAPTTPVSEYVPGAPATPGEIIFKGVAAALFANNAHSKYVDGSTVLVTDIVVTIEASRGTPLMTDLVTIDDGTPKPIKKIVRIPEAGTPIVWKLFVAG